VNGITLSASVLAMMKRFSIILAATLIATTCFAAFRSAGKYSGVVIFDRWGGCTLYSGIYVMYISEGVKEQLRPEAGKCVQIDATEVDQPINPGDGLIKKFKLIGPAPAAKEWESPVGFQLLIEPTFKSVQKPTFIIHVKNVTASALTLHLDSLAPTVLAKNDAGGDKWSPSDGPSSAVVTRDSFWVNESRIHGATDTWHWDVSKPNGFEQTMQVPAGGSLDISIAFALPQGQYDILAGYGGGVHDGQCIASNLVAVDVQKDGTASLVKMAGR